jgi:translocation protein SEC72
METFTLLPLTIDPATKAISSPDSTLESELEDLNRLTRAFTQLETPGQIPPAPAPVDPKRSVNITKLKESGNVLYRKGQFAESLKMYGLAIRMALDRPSWEASGLLREELSTLLNNRSQCFMAQQNWPEAMLDAEVAVELKRVGNIKAWYRKAQCLREMGRWSEAQEWVKSAIDFERAGPDKQNVGELEQLARDIDAAIERRGAVAKPT